MSSEFSYACKDYPETESCPGHFVAETEDEIWKLMELHASVAHGEDPGKWSNGDREYLKTLIKSG